MEKKDVKVTTPTVDLPVPTVDPPVPSKEQAARTKSLSALRKELALETSKLEAIDGSTIKCTNQKLSCLISMKELLSQISLLESEQAIESLFAMDEAFMDLSQEFLQDRFESVRKNDQLATGTSLLAKRTFKLPIGSLHASLEIRFSMTAK